MPFTTKQSDIFYNEETKQMYVCTVSCVTADRCDGQADELVYGALPIIYKIDKDTNYKTMLFPKNPDTFMVDISSSLFDLTPTCPEGTDFHTITKPLINYNKTTDRYSVTFLGKYTTDIEGASIGNFIFQDINTDFYLIDSKFYIPKEKFTTNPYTFANGYINSDLIIGGNTIRNNSYSFFGDLERSPDYLIIPSHVESVSALGFNLITHCVGGPNINEDDILTECLIADTSFPFLYSGGYITYNSKYTAFDPEYNIRVDFRARCFNTPETTAYGSTQAVGLCASRWAQQWTPGGPGEGFSVYFHECVNPAKGTVVPNGVGSTLGYSHAWFNHNEVAGTAQHAEGLFIIENPTETWETVEPGQEHVSSPLTVEPGQEHLKHMREMQFTAGKPANAFLGVGFDITGDFCMDTEEKPGWYQYDGQLGPDPDPDNTTHTQAPCSIGIRGSKHHETQVLTCVPMSSVAVAGAIPMHVSAAQVDASDVDFVDYRIDLSNRGTKVTVYNKELTETDYNVITEFRLNKPTNTSGVKYDPWSHIGEQVDGEWGKTLVPLQVGLSFTTGRTCSFFELSSFEVTGVKINNPYKEKAEPVAVDENDLTGKINYLELNSKNLREKLVKIKSDDKLDVELTIPATNRLAEIEAEKNIRDRITLCKGTDTEIIEEELDAKFTGLTPGEVDERINKAQQGTVDYTQRLGDFIKEKDKDKTVAGEFSVEDIDVPGCSRISVIGLINLYRIEYNGKTLVWMQDQPFDAAGNELSHEKRDDAANYHVIFVDKSKISSDGWKQSNAGGGGAYISKDAATCFYIDVKQMTNHTYGFEAKSTDDWESKIEKIKKMLKDKMGHNVEGI